MSLAGPCPCYESGLASCGATTLNRSIAIAGAGSIGCFVGGMLARAGRTVGLLARPRVIAGIEANGLRLSSFEGLDERVDATKLTLSQDPALFGNAGTVLVTVKSDDTAEVADLIAQHAPADAVIVSLQNGVGNVGVLRDRLPVHTVLAGMVPFNVLALGDGKIHRATSGDILIDPDAADTAAQLNVQGLGVRSHPDMTGIQWGKLLVNLNNALNALSNLPLRDQLAQRSWRGLFADQMSEGLAVMKAAAIHPVATTPLPASWTPTILKLPDALFQIVAKQMVRIDPKARSSMWEDLSRGRRTEIGHLQGTIVELARKHGIAVPLSTRIVTLVKDAEANAKGSPGLTPEQIRG